MKVGAFIKKMQKKTGLSEEIIRSRIQKSIGDRALDDEAVISVREMAQITVGLVLLAVLLPVGLNSWFNASITGLPQSIQDIWPIIGILVVVLVLLGFVPHGES